MILERAHLLVAVYFLAIYAVTVLEERELVRLFGAGSRLYQDRAVGAPGKTR